MSGVDDTDEREHGAAIRSAKRGRVGRYATVARATALQPDVRAMSLVARYLLFSLERSPRAPGALPGVIIASEAVLRDDAGLDARQWRQARQELVDSGRVSFGDGIAIVWQDLWLDDGTPNLSGAPSSTQAAISLCTAFADVPAVSLKLTYATQLRRWLDAVANIGKPKILKVIHDRIRWPSAGPTQAVPSHTQSQSQDQGHSQEQVQSLSQDQGARPAGEREVGSRKGESERESPLAVYLANAMLAQDGSRKDRVTKESRRAIRESLADGFTPEDVLLVHAWLVVADDHDCQLRLRTIANALHAERRHTNRELAREWYERLRDYDPSQRQNIEAWVAHRLPGAASLQQEAA